MNKRQPKMPTSRAALAFLVLELSAPASDAALPDYTEAVGDRVWAEAAKQAKEASGQQHVCGYGTWGDSGQLNQWDQGFSPCWPSTLNVAASWDVKLMARWSMETAQEFGEPNRGQLGPGVNVMRYAWNGRMGEYMSGEDPYLGARMVESQIRAYRKVDHPPLQVVKHWIPNTIEKHRTDMVEVVDERTLFEVYYPPFQAAVDAGVSSVMCSYNLINCTTGMCNAGHVYACANDDILNKHLKKKMGFKGIVMSDWDATKCQAPGSPGCASANTYIQNDVAAEGGLDMEMPGCMSFSGPVTKRAEEKERRLRWAYMVQGREMTGQPMKNKQVLKLMEGIVEKDADADKDEDDNKDKEESSESSKMSDSSSSSWSASSSSSSVSSSASSSSSSSPYSSSSYSKSSSEFLSAARKLEAEAAQGQAAWTTGVYQHNHFGKADYDDKDVGKGYRVKIYGEEWDLCKHEGSENYRSECKLDLADRIISESSVLLKNEGGVLPLKKTDKVALVGATACASDPVAQGGGSGWNGYSCNSVPKVNLRDGIAALTDSTLDCIADASSPILDDVDVAIVAATPEKAAEGSDRSTLQIFPEDADLIRSLVKKGKSVVVVINAPGPMITSTWEEGVAAILVTWLPGQQNGKGIAMTLYGEKYGAASASGRLPFTFPKCISKACPMKDELASVALGDRVEDDSVRVFSEKALVGYRWYHAKQMEVSYPFGFGLFAYGTAQVEYSGAVAFPETEGDSVSVSLGVTMSHDGPIEGYEVPQLYLSMPSSVPGSPESKPQWVLKGFQKVLLKPNAPLEVSFELTQRDLSYWDDSPGRSEWVMATGLFEACIGANFRDAIEPGRGSCIEFTIAAPLEPMEAVEEHGGLPPLGLDPLGSIPIGGMTMFLYLGGLILVLFVVRSARNRLRSREVDPLAINQESLNLVDSDHDASNIE